MVSKKQAVKFIRRTMPLPVVRGLEDLYRRGRIQVVSLRYGDPAHGQKVIAITGTNGKTTTVSYMNEILKEAGLKTAMFSTALIEVDGKISPNTLNATVPSTSLLMRFFRDAKRARVDYVLLEATSHALSQHKLDTVPILAAVITNLTQDHLDYHGNMDSYARAKAILFERRPKFIVLNHDDEWFDFFNKYPASGQKITYGMNPAAEACISKIKLYKKGSEAQVVIDGRTTLELATALPGKYNIYNMTAAASLAYLLGIDLEDIIEGVANLDGVPGRFERVVEGIDFDVIVDYAHTPDSLEKLLEAARAVTKNRIILVFGCTGDRDTSKRPIMGEVAARLADRIMLTDEENYTENAKVIRDQIYEGIVASGGAAKTTEIADRREAIKKALNIAAKGDTVLLTGLGHQQFRMYEGQKMPWNDADVVRELLAEPGGV